MEPNIKDAIKVGLGFVLMALSASTVFFILYGGAYLLVKLTNN